MQHLASFLAAVRSRVANKAVTSLHRKISSAENAALSAENAAHEAVDAARGAQMTARHASAEAMAATARAAAAAASAKHEGSVLLEEASVHRKYHYQGGFPKPMMGGFLACACPSSFLALRWLFRFIDSDETSQ